MPPERQFRPVEAGSLASLLAQGLLRRDGLVRVAVDGPPPADPDTLGAAIMEQLRAAGRPAHLVRAEDFLRDASVRLEYGHADAHALRHDWLDLAALRREVLTRSDAQFLPSLRDPVTNRSTRVPSRPLEPDAVLLVAGSMLLGRGLPFDRTVHLRMSAAARARRTSTDQQWTLDAFADYDATVDPAGTADVVISMEDPRRPAIAGSI